MRGDWSSHTELQELSLMQMKKKGTHLKKRQRGGWETANFMCQLDSSEGLRRDIQKQGGLGLVCGRDGRQPLDPQGSRNQLISETAV